MDGQSTTFHLCLRQGPRLLYEVKPPLAGDNIRSASLFTISFLFHHLCNLLPSSYFFLGKLKALQVLGFFLFCLHSDRCTHHPKCSSWKVPWLTACSGTPPGPEELARGRLSRSRGMLFGGGERAGGCSEQARAVCFSAKSDGICEGPVPEGVGLSNIE